MAKVIRLPNMYERSQRIYENEIARLYQEQISFIEQHICLIERVAWGFTIGTLSAFFVLGGYVVYVSYK